MNTNVPKYYVPCPHCGVFQLLQWPQVVWPVERRPGYLKSVHSWGGAKYVCAECGVHWGEMERKAALRQGEWRPVRPDASTVDALPPLYKPQMDLAGS